MESLSNHLKPQTHLIIKGWTQQKLPGPPFALIYFIFRYHFWTCSRSNCANANLKEWVITYREGRSNTSPRGRWWMLWTISQRSHYKCGSQGKTHKVRVHYLWPRWYVHTQLEANRRPSLIIYQIPQGWAKFIAQSQCNWLINYTKLIGFRKFWLSHQEWESLISQGDSWGWINLTTHI